MKYARIVVVGSANMDIVALATRIPMPGETVIGSSSSFSTGGKGANQAVAAARLGGVVSMIEPSAQILSETHFQTHSLLLEWTPHI
jgi:ribokinase